MGVVAVVSVVVRERCDAVCLRGQPPPSPSLGISPLRAVRTSLSSPRGTACPSPPQSLQPGVRTCAHIHTHILPLMRVLLFDVQSGSLAGSPYLGERERLVPWGAKEGQGIPGGVMGVTVTPALSRNSFFSPNSRVPPPSPKEVALVYSEDSVTVSPFPEI